MATTPLRPENRLQGYWKPRAAPRGHPVNVGTVERYLSFLGGAALGAYGLRQRSLPGFGLAALGANLIYRGVTGYCGLYARLHLSTAGPRGPNASVPANRGIRVDHTQVVNRPAEELFRYWRNLENLPRFMRHLEQVRSADGRSHWVACGPFGYRAEWDAVIIQERPNELIAWRSLPGSRVDSAGSVHFRRLPEGRGTEVKVELKYLPLGGRLGNWIARLFGEAPEREICEDLHRFKDIVESGERPT
jgi:uncharacterized membrane protein